MIENGKKKYRRKKGEGSFRLKDNGNLEYRFSYRNEYGEVKKKSVTGLDEEMCLDKAERFLELQEKKNRGINVESTIPDIVKMKYQADLEKNYVNEQGYSRNIANLGIIARSAIGNLPIIEITETQIDLFLRSITNYSNSVIGKVYQQLRQAFAIAFDKGLIEKNLMISQDLRCPKSKKKDKKVYAFTEEEQNRFVEGLMTYKVPKNRNNYKLQLLIELYSGMRMGEINALKPENIDLKNKVIHIRATVSRGLKYREFIKDGTKTYAGKRDIPIGNLLEPVLRKALEEKQENPENLIFYDYNKNGIIATYQVNSFYKRLCQKSGLEYHGQHSLRHTFATRCIEADVPPVVLKNWMGHKDIHITLDIYADVFNRMNFSAIEKFESYIASLEKEMERTHNGREQGER